MAVLIGTSGWHYADWRGRFYPSEVRQNDWLRFYAGRFQTVELNNAFYRLPDRTAFGAWADQVPDDFVVTVKASRYLTHVRRLKEPSEPVERLTAAARGLGPKLGPILLQLPPNLRCDNEALARTLGRFPNSVRVAVETRHDSWHDDRTREVLEAHGAAWAWVDPGSRDRPRWRTAGWGYVIAATTCFAISTTTQMGAPRATPGASRLPWREPDYTPPGYRAHTRRPWQRVERCRQSGILWVPSRGAGPHSRCRSMLPPRDGNNTAATSSWNVCRTGGTEVRREIGATSCGPARSQRRADAAVRGRSSQAGAAQSPLRAGRNEARLAR